MGQHDFAKFHEVAFTGCKGALIVADISREETIENLNYWQKSLYESEEEEIPVVLIGNKNDLAPDFKSGVNMFKKTSEKFKFPSYLTSAKTGENVEEAFFIMGKSMLKADLK
jgi:GTPase SAR1 family protein